MTAWTTKDVPSQEGRLAIVTGTGGLGYETALVLAQAGATVVLAGRNEAKGRVSVEKIRVVHPGARIAFEKLDLASLASVAAFARHFADDHSSLDLLVNNAGVMAPPTRQVTSDGFELQFGTNYLGHFALTAHLLPLLKRGRQTRVVHVSSGAHHTGKIRFDDLQWERRYRPWFAYSQSKLANLMFAFELQRRSDANGWGLMSNAAHPGYARTELIPNGPGAKGLTWTAQPHAHAAADEPDPGRRCPADPVRRHRAGSRRRRLLRAEPVVRNGWPAEAGPHRPEGQGRGRGGPAVGGLRAAHGRRVRRPRDRGLNRCRSEP